MDRTRTSEPLDAERVAELTELFGDEESLLELFQEFFEDLPPRIRAMREGVDGASAELVDSAAHAIKGSSGNLGAAGIHAVARAVEELARAERLEEIGPHLEDLEREISRLQEHLREHGLT